ncbi:MAG: VCBS repeat-containing protein [Verrucomicrobia bacterium]|nr:VCBS repeat-containing protein [Verrucomicrobiota bacterium]
MRLGQYPDQVPTRLRIPPSAFASEYPLPRFPNIATEVGLAVEDPSGGSVPEDFDGDGQLGVMYSAMGLASPLRYFRNTGTGKFAEETEAAGLTGLTGGLNLVSGDNDNDGRLDLYLGTGDPEFTTLVQSHPP